MRHSYHTPTWASHLPTNPPPPISFMQVYQGGPKFYLLPFGGTTPFYFDPLLNNLSPLNTTQIMDETTPTVPRLPAVAICKSDPTGFLLTLVFILPPASPMYHLLIYLLSFL